MSPDSALQQMEAVTKEAPPEVTEQVATEENSSDPAVPSEEVAEVVIPERNTRFKDILKPEVLEKTQAIVVGVGAIGRQLVLQLAAVGVKNIWIIDPEDVEIENLGAQGFFMADMGKPKVEALAELCALVNDQVQIKTSKTKFRKEFVADMKFEGEETADEQFAIFSCVDDMKARKSIWLSFTERFISEDGILDPRALFVDSRMGAETARVLAVSSMDGKDWYPRTLFAEGEGLEQSCTSKTTICCANFAAAIVMGQFSKWSRGMMVDKDLLYNILFATVDHDSEDLV